MSSSLRVLIVDDSEADAALIVATLRGGGYDVVACVVDAPASMRAALVRESWDVITSDHPMPHFSAPAAHALAMELCPLAPFIIVSGEIDVGLAVSLMKEGAKDFIQKRELPRLVPTIQRELLEVAVRREGRETKAALEFSETRYRRLFETAQDGILILDADTGLIQDVNPFLIEMLGYSKDELVGKKLWEIGAFRDKAASQAAFRDLSSSGYVRYEDLPLQSSDGRLVQVEFVSNVYSVERARVAQCNIRNITERKSAEAEIQRLYAEMEQRVRERTEQLVSVNRELETFNYAVSHDLRAPLRQIQGFTSLLKEVWSEEEKPDSLHLIERIRLATERMNALIEALLELARLSVKALSRQIVDLSAVVHEIAEELRQAQPDRDVEFVIAEGVVAHADAPLLRIVLENLLGNAWKFTSGRAHARIAFGTVTEADGGVAYFVKDDGAGFDMASSGKLFGAFQRLHTEKEFPGTGIGLATVRRIVHRHGGWVRAEGKVGEGATFYFTVGDD